MREFSFKKAAAASSNSKAGNLMDELTSLNPEDLANNLHGLLNEIQYSCKSSIDKVHPNLAYLSDACKNIGAIVICLPLLTKNNKMASILSNPDMLTHLPNIDVRQSAFHFNTLIEAGKLYLGTNDEKVSNSDIAKQLFSLLGQILSNSDEKGVIERTGKMFARNVNDQLHILFPLDEAGQIIGSVSETNDDKKP